MNATSGALTLVGPGTCTVTATAAGTDNYNEVAVTATVTAEAADTLVLNLDDIAGDDTVNIAEKRDGFVISGDTGSEVGVTVSVTIGSQSPLTTTSAAGGAWSVSVPPNATYITEPSAMVTMSATKTGFTAPSDVTRTLTVDLTAPIPAHVHRAGHRRACGRGNHRHDRRATTATDIGPDGQRHAIGPAFGADHDLVQRQPGDRSRWTGTGGHATNDQPRRVPR